MKTRLPLRAVRFSSYPSEQRIPTNVALVLTDDLRKYKWEHNGWAIPLGNVISRIRSFGPPCLCGCFGRQWQFKPSAFSGADAYSQSGLRRPHVRGDQFWRIHRGHQTRVDLGGAEWKADLDRNHFRQSQWLYRVDQPRRSALQSDRAVVPEFIKGNDHRACGSSQCEICSNDVGSHLSTKQLLSGTIYIRRRVPLLVALFSERVEPCREIALSPPSPVRSARTRL